MPKINISKLRTKGQHVEELNFLAPRRFVRVFIYFIGQQKDENNRTGATETRRSEEGEFFVGKNGLFPLLTSASPRLLFDFPFRFDASYGLKKRPVRNAAEPTFITPALNGARRNRSTRICSNVTFVKSKPRSLTFRQQRCDSLRHRWRLISENR